MVSTVFGWNWGVHAHPVEHCVFGGLESAKLPLEPWMREAQSRTDRGKRETMSCRQELDPHKIGFGYLLFSPLFRQDTSG